jgi:solute carrier family 35 protein E3
MADKDKSRLLADGFAWFGNVSTSVAIIFVNKILMSSTGYGFRYATTLCAAHYLACSASIYATQTMGYVKKVSLPAADLALFTATANTSIVTLNLSLLLNKVGFYQIAKLLIIPFVCLVERFWLGKQFSGRVILSVITVVCGVGIVTVSDFAMGDNLLGLVVAALSVVSSGMQQIFCRSMQQKHKLSSHELLSNTAPAQGWSLLLIGPFLDYYVVDAWVLDFNWSTAAAVTLGASCALAVLVNLSQFACLGRFTAVSYQVLGHSKTILVLLGGWLFLGDVITAKQAAGMVLAVAGMVGYGIASSQEAAPAKAADKKSGAEDVETPLLKEDLATAVSGRLENSFRSGSASDLKAAAGFKRESV